jgi:hypothetical protein
MAVSDIIGIRDRRNPMASEKDVKSRYSTWHWLELEIFACLICRLSGTKGVFQGKSMWPQAKCVEKIYNIRPITVNIIPKVLVCHLFCWPLTFPDYDQVIWLHLPDIYLQVTSDTTLIRNFQASAVAFKEQNISLHQRYLTSSGGGIHRWAHALLLSLSENHQERFVPNSRL